MTPSRGDLVKRDYFWLWWAVCVLVFFVVSLGFGPWPCFIAMLLMALIALQEIAKAKYYSQLLPKLPDKQFDVRSVTTRRGEETVLTEWPGGLQVRYRCNQQTTAYFVVVAHRWLNTCYYIDADGVRQGDQRAKLVWDTANECWSVGAVEHSLGCPHNLFQSTKNHIECGLAWHVGCGQNKCAWKYLLNSTK